MYTGKLSGAFCNLAWKQKWDSVADRTFTLKVTQCIYNRKGPNHLPEESSEMRCFLNGERERPSFILKCVFFLGILMQ